MRERESDGEMLVLCCSSESLIAKHEARHYYLLITSRCINVHVHYGHKHE